MKMTLANVRTKYQSLLVLADCHLPSKLSYAIAKNLSNLEKEAELIEKQRKSMIESYAQKDETDAFVLENGNYVLGENLDVFCKEFDAFLQMETEIHIHKCPYHVLDMLDDPRFENLTPAQMLILDFMMEQEEICENEKETIVK